MFLTDSLHPLQNPENLVQQNGDDPTSFGSNAKNSLEPIRFMALPLNETVFIKAITSPKGTS
jgi:hypothetical protein